MAQSVPVQPMPEFNPDAEVGASVATRWTTWLSDFEMFLLASGITDTKRQRALLLYTAGPRVREIFKQIPNNGDENNFNTAKEKLAEYFQPQTNRRYAWKIRKRCQGSGNRAKCLAAKKSYRELHENKNRLETDGEADVNKTGIQNFFFRRVFSWKETLFHFFIINNLVCMLTLFSLFGWFIWSPHTYDRGFGEIEPRTNGSPAVLHQRPATQAGSLDLGLHVWA